MGDQIGGLNHSVGVGNEMDGTDVGDVQTEVLTTDRMWGMKDGKKQRTKFKTWRVQEIILFLREKGKIRTVTVLCDEMNFGHFQLELPVGYPCGNAQQQLALRTWSSRDKLGLECNLPFPESHVDFPFPSFISQSGPNCHWWFYRLLLLLFPCCLSPEVLCRLPWIALGWLAWVFTIQSLASHHQLAYLKNNSTWVKFVLFQYSNGILHLWRSYKIKVLSFTGT